MILIMKSNLWYRPSGNYKNVLSGSWFPQGPSSLGKNWQLEVHSTCSSGILFPGRILWCTDLSRRETTILGLETLKPASQWRVDGIICKSFPFHIPHYSTWPCVTGRTHFTLHCFFFFALRVYKENNGVWDTGKSEH